MNPHFREKRLYPRRALGIPVIFEDEFGEALFSVPCKDMSEGGLSLDIVDFPLRAGSMLFLSFTIPSYDRVIRTTGEVVRRAPQGETPGGIGVRFVGLPPVSAERIHNWIISR